MNDSCGMPGNARWTGTLPGRLLWVAPPHCLAETPPTVQNAIIIERTTEYRRDNGSRFLLLPDSPPPAGTAHVTVAVGSTG